MKKCCVVGCGMRAGRDNVKFFRFPLIETRRKKFIKLSEDRQRAWIKAINRKDLKMSSLKHSHVCSRHFISGQSSNLIDTLNPDYVPTLNLGYEGDINSHRSQARYLRTINRKAKRGLAEEIVKNKPENSPIDLTENAPIDLIENFSESYVNKNQHSQTDDIDYKEHCNAALLEKCKKLTQRCENLGNELKKIRSEKNTSTYDELKKSRKKTKYLTAFEDFDTLEIIFDLVKDSLPVSKKMGKFDIFVMTLTKIRLDLPFTYLSFKHQVTLRTVSKLFYQTVVILHEHLGQFIFWPDKEASRRNMPSKFNIFGNMAPIIIDCFEVFSEKPGNHLARANTFSNYKHHNTLKYLVGISVFGSIIYISKSFGGRCSDKFIVESCGILDNLEEADVVLADRGFLIQNAVNKKKARLIMPSFKNGKSQLEPVLLENNRQIASVRIHVERVIGVLRQKFLMLTNRQPITAISKKNDITDNMYCDYIMKIACAIVNLCPPIINNSEE